MSYKHLGDYIIEKVEFNEGNKYDLLLGVSNKKYFQKAKTNTIDIDLTKYRVAHHNQFVFNRATTRNGDKISIALRKGESCVVSPSYRIFEVKDENVLNSDYLLMWFSRPEFDRYARFKSHGSAHEFFDMDEMINVELPIPTIEKQREIVAEYQAIENKIKINEQICEKLEATAQTLYKQWFVDFEFPNEEGQPYKSSGGAMVFNEELEKEIPEGWEVKELGKFIQSFSKSHNFYKKQLIFFNTSDILNGEFLHSEYMNVDEMPGQAKKSIKKDDILYSEIRPNNRRFALVRNDADDYVVSTKLMVLRRLNNEIGLYRIYYYLISDETIKDFQDSAEGRSGTFPQITFDEDLKFRKIIIGSNEVEDKMENIFKNCFYQVYNLKDQNKQLTQLQSLLLSRLATLEG